MFKQGRSRQPANIVAPTIAMTSTKWRTSEMDRCTIGAPQPSWFDGFSSSVEGNNSQHFNFKCREARDRATCLLHPRFETRKGPILLARRDDAKLTDSVEKGVPSIETAGPKTILRSLRILNRHRCSVRLSFSTPSVFYDTVVLGQPPMENCLAECEYRKRAGREYKIAARERRPTYGE